MQQRLTGPSPLCGHVREALQRPELAGARDDRLGGVRAERADQLVLEVGVAGEEVRRRYAGRREPAPHDRLRGSVVQTRDVDAQPLRPVAQRERPDVGDAAHRHDRHALLGEGAAEPRGERLQRDPVAVPFDEDDRPRG